MKSQKFYFIIFLFLFSQIKSFEFSTLSLSFFSKLEDISINSNSILIDQKPIPYKTSTFSLVLRQCDTLSITIKGNGSHLKDVYHPFLIARLDFFDQNKIESVYHTGTDWKCDGKDANIVEVSKEVPGFDDSEYIWGDSTSKTTTCEIKLPCLH